MTVSINSAKIQHNLLYLLSNSTPIRITLTNILNEHISNISHITENESFSINAASTITSGISLSNGNQSNPTISISISIISISTTTSTLSVAPAQPNHSQIVEYDPNSTFQNLLEEAQQIYKNQRTDSKRLQYSSANTSFVTFIFKNYRRHFLPPCIDE